MKASHLKIVGIVCLVVCGICIFVAFERYQSNAGNVEAMNNMRRSSPLGQMMGEGDLKPATPAATKYAALFAAMTGIAGIVCLVKASKGDASPEGSDVQA